jgi:endonuclease-8
MPEGDTVYKLAEALAPMLRGQTLTGATLRGYTRPDLVSRRVERVTSKGKHLYISFDDGRTLRTHLGMHGSWHRYRPGEPWRRPERQASLVLAVDGQLLVCFNARDAELLGTGGFRLLDQRNRLGPDLIRETPPAESLRHRARELLAPETLVVDLLLDQRVASGIGNVYKSELLFLERCAPTRRLGALGPDLFARLYRTAGQLLKNNLGHGPRITRRVPDSRGPVWVYARAGLPCLRCGGSVQRGPLGANPRITYWCPHCQPDSPGGP